MQISILLMEQIFELFLMILMGFIIVKAGIVKEEDSKVLSKIILYLIIPCVIINAFQVNYTKETVNGLLLALVASILLQIILLLVVSLISRLFSLNEVESASIYYSNSGNLIVPIVTFVLGQKWILYGSMIGPASMIVTGMLFAGMNMKDIFANKRVYFISALRMIVIPLIALLLIKISHLTTLSSDAPKIMLIVFLAVITPSASTVTQMCQVYGNDAHYASAINVVTTLCAIVTMPLMVLLFSFI